MRFVCFFDSVPAKLKLLLSKTLASFHGLLNDILFSEWIYFQIGNVPFWIDVVMSFLFEF